MPSISNSIIIECPPEQVFSATNEIDRWPEIFNEYAGAKVLTSTTHGPWTEITFELTSADGSSWTSWRLIDRQSLKAVATRLSPLSPFRYMHLTWRYEEHLGGTHMTWAQDFEFDPTFDIPLEKAVARMVAHTKANQGRIKMMLERSATPFEQVRTQ